MAKRTSTEIATIAALKYFSQHPDEGLAFIKDIYDLAHMDALAEIGKPLEQPEPEFEIKFKPLSKVRKMRKIKVEDVEPQIKKVRRGRKPTVVENRQLAETKSLNERIEAAYMGEHMNIQPEEKQIAKKPLSPAEKRLYDYLIAHPDARKPKVEQDLLMSEAMYYFLKSQLKKKGWISGNGVVDMDTPPHQHDR